MSTTRWVIITLLIMVLIYIVGMCYPSSRSGKSDIEYLVDDLNVDWTANDDYLYAITMTDPNAPSATPEGPDFLHWMIVDIPGRETDRGATVVPYMGPEPPPESGWHNYTTRVWQQPSRMGYVKPPERVRFNMARFAQDHGWIAVHEIVRPMRTGM